MLKKHYTNIKMNKLTKIIFLTFVSLVLLFFKTVVASEKIKIGLLVPMTGKNKDLGQSIIKAVSLAVKDIDSDLIEIIPKDTATKPNQTLRSAFELKEMGVKVVIGPIFYESITYLDEMKDLTFLSLTNKTLDLPKNVISAGINSTSQLNTIKKFLEKNNIQKTIFLTPIQDFEFEVKRGIKNSKIKIFKDYVYNTDPTKLTSQIEEITNYKIRKKNLEDEIYRVKESNEINKEKKIILVPGRLTSWKGQELLIESINLVKIELGYEAFHVVILGSDQGRNLYKKKLIRLTEQYRLTNQIKFIDHCNDMALAYKVSDIVISPSIEPEAFGRVAV